MKKNSLLILASIFAVSLWSCSKVEVWEPEEEELSEYSQVYIPQAESNPVQTLVMNEDMKDAFEAQYNAYLGGPVDAPKNLSVSFSVNSQKVSDYNSSKGTDYVILPQNIYSISSSQVTIEKGKRSSENITVKITPNDDLEAGEYLLPVSISSSDVKINENLSTVYFIVKVPETELPRTKVLSLGANWGNLISTGPDGVLYIRNNDNYVSVYKPDKDGMYTIDPIPFPGDPWAISGWFYYIKDNIEMVVNDDGWYGMFRFDIEEETYLLNRKESVNYDDPWPDNFGFFYGDGWDKYIILPRDEFIFFLHRENGNILRAPMEHFLDPYVGTWHKPGWVEDVNNIVGTGYDDYKDMMRYENNFLGLKNDGTLWIIPVSEDGDLGEAKEFGTGWNAYKKVMVTIHGLIALDDEGNLYRYDIEPDGYYEL